MGALSRTYAERRSEILPGVVWWAGANAGSVPVLPDGCMDVLWTGERLLVAGPDTAVQVAEPGGASCAVRFDPGVAPTLLRARADSLRDQRLGLDEVLPVPVVRRWATRLARAENPARELERLMAQGLDRSQVPGWVSAVADGLRLGHPVPDVARQVGFSARQLQRQVVTRFGYPPKLAQRILRGQRVVTAIAGGMELSAAAAVCGYADYAHLFRESMALFERSPASFRAAG